MSISTDLREVLHFSCHELSFIDGQLMSLDYEKAFQSSRGIAVAERYTILKQVSLNVKSNIELLLEAACLKSYRYREYTKKDLEVVITSYLYFAKCSTKVPKEAANQLTVHKSRVIGLILDQCPIYLMLSWLTCGVLAAGNSVTIVVNHDLLKPSICFAFLLRKSGIPPGTLNIIPYNSNEFLKIISLKSTFSGIVSKQFSFPEVETAHPILYQNLLRDHSVSPILILKSADIDSVVNFFLNSTQDHNAIWHPNMIYVEEVVYANFYNTLKHAIAIHNEGIENEETCKTVYLDSILNELKGQGYEILSMFHRFSMCSIVLNHDLTSLPVNFSCDGGFSHQIVSILPIRTASEAISLINSAKCLCVSLWCNDLVESTSLPFKLQTGTVWLNSGGCYDPSVPVPLWSSEGVGSFSGMPSLLENLKYVIKHPKTLNFGNLYPVTRNSMLPKRSITDASKLALSAFESWGETDITKRQSMLENVALNMNKNWGSHFKLIMNQTEKSTWQCSINYLRYWSTFPIADSLNQLFTTSNFHVFLKREPLGIIAVIAESVPFDTLMFLIAGFLVYGNTIIVGITKSNDSSFIASELESLFKTGFVTVVLEDDRLSLEKQFSKISNITSIWHVEKSNDTHEILFKNNQIKKNVLFENQEDVKNSAQIIEMNATKFKSVWLPCLF